MRPIIYQLFVRHFSNPTTTGKPWGTLQENGSGKFAHITLSALQGIKELGITHIWFTGVLRHATQTNHQQFGSELISHDPKICKGIAGSPYAVTDYYDVDPDLAENPRARLDEFKELLHRCEKVGLIPLMDFIPNHVSRAYYSYKKPNTSLGNKDNPHHFFEKNNAFYYLIPGQQGQPPLTLPDGIYEPERFLGKVTGNNAITWAPSPYDWYETVKLNYGFDFTQGIQAINQWTLSDTKDIPTTWKCMDDIIQFWQDFGIGGFRCDMAHLVPMPFWSWVIKRAKTRANAQNKAILFIAEAYNDSMKTTEGDPSQPLLTSGFDAIYASEIYHIAHKIYEEDKWANDFDAYCHNDDPVFHKAVRYLENHDEPRLGSPLHWGNVGTKIAPAMSTLMYGLSGGALLFYNGQEVGEKAEGPSGYGGDNGRTSIFDYTSLPQLQHWTNNLRYDGVHLTEEENKLRTHYKDLGKLLNEPALAQGLFFGLNWFNKENINFGRLVDESYSGHYIFAYIRHDFTSNQTALIVSNLNPHWDFPHLKVLIPLEAFKWMKWKTSEVNVKRLGSSSPLTTPYTFDEVFNIGIEVPLKAGEGIILSLME